MADTSKIQDMFSGLNGRKREGTQAPAFAHPVALVLGVNTEGPNPVLDVQIHGEKEVTQVRLSQMRSERVGVKVNDIASLDSLYFDRSTGQAVARWANKAGVRKEPIEGTREIPPGGSVVRQVLARVNRYRVVERDNNGRPVRDSEAERAAGDGQKRYKGQDRTQVEVLGATELVREASQLDKALGTAYAQLSKVVPDAHPARSRLLLSVGTLDGNVKGTYNLGVKATEDGKFPPFDQALQQLRNEQGYKEISQALQTPAVKELIQADQMRITVTPRAMIGFGKRSEEAELQRQNGDKAGVSDLSFFQTEETKAQHPFRTEFRPSRIVLTKAESSSGTFWRVGAIRPVTSNSPTMAVEDIALCAQEMAQEKFFTSDPDRMPALTTKPSAAPQQAAPQQAAPQQTAPQQPAPQQPAPQQPAPQQPAPQQPAPQQPAPQQPAPQQAAADRSPGFTDSDFGTEDFGGDDFSDAPPAVAVNSMPPQDDFSDFDNFDLAGVEELENRLVGTQPSKPAPGPR